MAAELGWSRAERDLRLNTYQHLIDQLVVAPMRGIQAQFLVGRALDAQHIPHAHAHPRDQLELGFEEVDMLFLAVENGFEQLAAVVVAHRLAMGDRVLQQRQGFHLESKIGLEDLLDRLADVQLAE